LDAARNNYRGLGTVVPDAIGEPQTITAGQSDIAERNGRRGRVQHLQSFLCCARSRYCVATGLEPAAHELSYAAIIVDDQD
jgi:hypothetical protein